MKDEPQKSDIITLRVEAYGSDGAGVSHMADGRVVFVRDALAGELCRVKLQKMGKSAAWGVAIERLEPSAARIEADCPYYPSCGGCQLRHMDYEEELRFKHNRVQEALRRIGGADITLDAIHKAADTERYRNKLQFPIAPGQGGGIKIGFFRSRSHEVIDVADCLLQPAAGSRLRAALKSWMEQYGITAYDERLHQGLLRHLYVRSNAEGQSLCVLVINGKKLPHEETLITSLCKAEPQLVGLMLSVNREKTNVIMGAQLRLLWGVDSLEDSLCGFSFRLSPHSFYQVNRAQTELLYRRVLAFADLSGGELVLDLYCGIGTIGLALARKAGRVIGAEIVEAAVQDARENARRAGLHNAEFICADAGEMAKILAKRGEKPAVICVDPPRKGLSLEVIEAIAQMSPQRVVYVSCDPGTLGRDVKLFAARGYVATRAEACDMFPRTVHIESIVLLERKPG